jgi:hypothetical protein
MLDEFAVITCDYPSEHEFGCAAFASPALLSRRPDDAFRNDRMDRWLDVFAARKPAAVFRPRQGELGPDLRRIASAPLPVLHEGYLHDPRAECSAEIEQLRRDLGGRFWAVSPAVWSAWGSKTQFRPRCQSILGAGSVPPGIERSVNDAGEVSTLLKDFEAEPSGPVIVKLPGSGGFANLVLEPGRPATEVAIAALWDDNAYLPRPVDVVIESWLPWESTHSVSFLLGPDEPPAFLAACEQVVDGTGIFIGSRSNTGLSEDDEAAVLAHVSRLFDAMAADGYVGVAAIDVVIGSADAWAGRGLALPSGRRMIVIECNPRFNYHNRIALIVERFARAWDVPSHRLQWTAVNIAASENHTAETLLATRPRDAEIGVPPPPERDRPARRVFAHRTERIVELTVSLRPA